MLDDAGIWSTVLWLSGVVIVAYAAILWLASVVWVAGDIQRRTNSAPVQFSAIAFAAVFFLPGLILYIALRPSETMEERAERRMEMQALSAHAAQSPTCKNCYRTLRESFVRCPYCATQMGVACADCERVNEASWVVCPYCGGREPATPTARTTPERAAADGRVVPALTAIAPAARRNGHAPAR